MGRAPLTRTQRTQRYEIVAQARLHGSGVSRNDLIDELGYSRRAVDARLETAAGLGLVVPAGRGPSSGGRGPDMHRFAPEAGTVLGLAVSYDSSSAVLADLSGAVLAREDWPEGVRAGPQTILPRAVAALERLRSRAPADRPPWGLGVTVPTPVDFRTGDLVEPVASEGDSRVWTGLPLRESLERTLSMPVWVDDEVTTYNPGQIVIGGEAAAAGPLLPRAIAQEVRQRVLPLLAERLVVRTGDSDDALTGVCRLVFDRLISPHWLGLWIDAAYPAGVAALVGRRRQDL